MIDDSKLRKYFLYAVGEIFLVVVGILIALGVNNWNQKNKEIRSGDELLERIQRDLVQDTSDFRNTIIENNKLREEIKGLMVSLYDGVENVEEVKHMSGIYDKALDQVFAPNDNTYKSILSSGTLSLIQNQQLKEEIVNLYSYYDQTGTLLDAINIWMGGLAVAVDTETNFIKFNDFVYDIYTRPEMLSEEDYAFLNDKNDPGFKILVRAISGTAFNQKVRNVYYENMIARCDKVLKQIDDEIR
ncbi:MAG: hypothetical protein HKN22_07840 [Bacteroidia bacterium]|nr:hypothetical protein [Bacteroidia bacterium]